MHELKGFSENAFKGLSKYPCYFFEEEGMCGWKVVVENGNMEFIESVMTCNPHTSNIGLSDWEATY